MKTKHNHQNTDENNTNQTSPLKRNTNKKSRKYIEGIFWIIGGAYLLIGNFFPLERFNNVMLLILGVFLVGSFLFIKLNKLYFLLGILLLGIWLGNILTDGTKVRWLWPCIILVMGVAIVIYGITSKTLKKIRYFISGGSIIIIAILLFLSIHHDISLSEILRKFWPAALILLGATRISSMIHTTRKSSNNTTTNENSTDTDETITDGADAHITAQGQQNTNDIITDNNDTVNSAKINKQ